MPKRSRAEKAEAKMTEPVFALIEHHRICFAKMERTSAEDPESRASREWMAREAHARRRLIGCMPTTLRGLQALVDYVRFHEGKVAESWDDGEAERLLETVSHFLLHELSPMASMPPP